MRKMNKICFIGGGSFGTALAIVLGNKGYEVSIWARNEEVVKEINQKRTNTKYLQDVTIPVGVDAYTDLEKAIEGAEVVILSVPSHMIRTMSKEIAKYIDEKAIVVNIAKGIEEGSLKRLSEVIEEELPHNHVVVFSGPSHAEEVARNIPTTVVVSGKNMDSASIIQDLFMTPYLRVYTNDDLIGVEVGGAVKNIIAFAAGILDGIGYGDNAKAALMTRGMSEIIRVGEKLGGKKETFYGLTGMGDLIVTCTSNHSRNRRAGILVGQGYSASEASEKVGMVVEGIKAIRAFYALKEKYDVTMPITDSLYKGVYEDLDPKKAIEMLMTREKKHENY